MAIRSCDSDQLKNDVAIRSSDLTDCQKKVLDVVFGSTIPLLLGPPVVGSPFS